MAELKVTCTDFSINAYYVCTTVKKEYYAPITGDLIGSDGPTNTSSSSGSVETSKSFTYTLPDDVTVTGAYICATLSSVQSLYGVSASTSTIAGKNAATGSTVEIDVKSKIVNSTTAQILKVPFVLAINAGPAHDHSSSGGGSSSSSTDSSGTETVTTTWTTRHSGTVNYSDVYLVIEYEFNYQPPTLTEYTDPEPVSGETYVKAVHMTELHDNINLLRPARKLDAYTFSTITAMDSLLKNWNADVEEIRAALDEVCASLGITYDWIELGDNYPRLDVLLQLREAVQYLVDYGV